MSNPTWLVSTQSPWDHWARQQTKYLTWKNSRDAKYNYDRTCTETQQFPLTKLTCEKCHFRSECPFTSYSQIQETINTLVEIHGALSEDDL